MGKVAAVIVAGGSGKRMGMGVKKQFIELEGKTILSHTVEALNKCKVIDEIILVVGADDLNKVREEMFKSDSCQKISQIVAGGAERQDSVYNGLLAVSEEIQYVMIHDGARPFINEEIVERALEATIEKGATVVAVPVKDTIKVINEKMEVEGTPDRSTLWAVQTPQSFEKELLMKAYSFAEEKQLQVTDDSMLVEAYGHKVYVVEGDYNNIKITTPEDLVIGQAILKEKA